MTQELDPQPTDKVLEIGTGRAVQAAILSPLVKDVYTIEIVEELGTRPKSFSRIGITRTFIALLAMASKAGLSTRLSTKSLSTCSPEKVPEPLVEQIKRRRNHVHPSG